MMSFLRFSKLRALLKLIKFRYFHRNNSTKVYEVGIMGVPKILPVLKVFGEAEIPPAKFWDRKMSH